MKRNAAIETPLELGQGESSNRWMFGDRGISLPAFLPDATHGVVRGVDAGDLESVGVEAVVMSVFHLMQKPGSSTVAALGGLHAMTGWNRPIFTDSGGFQAYSLVRQNPKNGSLSDQGIRFKPEGSERDFLLTPEKSIQLQMAYGGDVLFCLDDCTHVADATEEQERAVLRTLRWAKRCREEFDRLLAQRKPSSRSRPMLFGVVQGGADPNLRRRCAEGLLELGFDGYGYGGWPLDNEGNLVAEILALCRELIPNQFPMHALGVGHPYSVVRCQQMGYATFDSALPTRDARNGRLYQSTTPINDLNPTHTADWFRYLYIDDDRHFKTNQPLLEGCDCLACRRYSIGYLRHLHKCGDTLYFRLATLHNLCFMTRLMGRLAVKN